MEKINRNNYEAWFLDYLEGNLGAEEKHDLMVFLEQNPDLKKELDLDLSEVSLNPSATLFENKESLKVTDDSVLSLNSADTWMLESVEGNLPASKQQELDDFVRRHQLEKTYTAYRSTILKADLNEVFEDKKRLRVATGIIIPMYARVAAIAAVAVLLIGIALNQSGGNKEMATQNESGNVRMLASKTESADWMSRVTETNDSLRNNTDEMPGSQNSLNHQRHEQEKTNEEFIVPGNLIAVDENNQKDTVNTTINVTPDGDKIVNKQEIEQPENPEKDDKPEDDVAVHSDLKNKGASVITEEPYKIVTDAASNVTNREVYFTRDRNTATNEYVAYGFKIGGFEFERKK